MHFVPSSLLNIPLFGPQEFIGNDADMKTKIMSSVYDRLSISNLCPRSIFLSRRIYRLAYQSWLQRELGSVAPDIVGSNGTHFTSWSATADRQHLELKPRWSSSSSCSSSSLLSPQQLSEPPLFPFAEEVLTQDRPIEISLQSTSESTNEPSKSKEPPSFENMIVQRPPLSAPLKKNKAPKKKKAAVANFG